MQFTKEIEANFLTIIPATVVTWYFVRLWINSVKDEILDLKSKMVGLPLHASEMHSHLERIKEAEDKANSAVPREVCDMVQERVMSMLESIKEDVMEIKERIR